ncbi:hypothetical protein D9M72_322840 [compost metagenome]
MPDLAACDLDILLGDDVLDVDGGDAEIGHAIRIEPDAHRIAALTEKLHVPDARQALQRIKDLQVGVIADRGEIDRIVRRIQADEHGEIGDLLGDRDAGLVDERGKRGGRLGDAVLDVECRDVDRITHFEGNDDARRAVVRTRRGHVEHARHAVDLLFERRRHRVGDHLGAGARIIGGNHDLRRRHIGKLRDRQQEIADGARKRHDDRDGRCEDRPVNEEVDHGGIDPLQALPSWRAA